MLSPFVQVQLSKQVFVMVNNSDEKKRRSPKMCHYLRSLSMDSTAIVDNRK